MTFSPSRVFIDSTRLAILGATTPTKQSFLQRQCSRSEANFCRISMFPTIASRSSGVVPVGKGSDAVSTRHIRVQGARRPSIQVLALNSCKMITVGNPSLKAKNRGPQELIRRLSGSHPSTFPRTPVSVIQSDRGVVF